MPWGGASGRKLCSLVACFVAMAFGFAYASPAFAQFDPDYEQRNYSKINERATQEHGQPGYRALLTQQAIDDEVERADIALNDPERNFSGNLCAQHKDGCAGDVRLYRWDESGYGINVPVQYIARSGAIISGHIWASREGPALRPGIVITTGSVQAPEELYLYAATTLAKKGYVVMTYDVQGQGRSDTRGEAPDEDEGVPAQQPGNFIGGTEDALNFFLSGPASPYVPLPSDSSGTVHSARQERRVAEGRNAAYNPLNFMLDSDRIGIAGHSLGATAISTVCCDGPGRQANEVVDAIVAWDNLTVSGGIVPRVPALGMSNDYGLTPTPYTSLPNPQGKNAASSAYSAAGVDTAQLNIRGGTHYEYSYIPDPGFGATWRGMDMAAWYTAAWFDKYVKGDPTADARLLTDRWRADGLEAGIDPDLDGNLYSRYFLSRIDIGLAAGGRLKCGNLRDLQSIEPGDNCTGALTPDSGPPDYSYLAEAQTPDPGNYPRPGGAAMLRVPLVPEFERCTAPSNTHVAPLDLGSCSPAAQQSDLLTTSTIGRGAGSVILKVQNGDSGTPEDEADVSIAASMTDVRLAPGGSDYVGQVLLRMGMRLTDRANRFHLEPVANEPATVQDTQLAAPIDCIASAGSGGSSCELTTSADALVPGFVVEGRRMVVSALGLAVEDAGADGDVGPPASCPPVCGTGDESVFLSQGLFAP